MRGIRLSAGVLAVVLLLGGCGAGRSPAAFCSTYDEQKRAFLDKYEKAERELASGEDLFGGIAMTFEMFGDIVAIFEALDKVAPDDIEPDVAALRDFFQKQIDSAPDAVKNPAGTLLGGLVSGFAVQGSWKRVGAYVTDHCENG